MATYIDESGQSGRNFIYVVDSMNDRLVQSTLDRDKQPIRIVNPVHFAHYTLSVRFSESPLLTTCLSYIIAKWLYYVLQDG